MRFTKRIISVICILVLLCLTVCGCSNQSWAIKAGEQTVSVGMFAYKMKLEKSNYLTQNSQTDSKELWTEADEDGQTLSDTLQESVINQLVNTLLWRQQFEKLGLSFDETLQQQMDKSIEEITQTYGGKEKLEEILAANNLTYDEYIQSVYYDPYIILAVVDYYFGEKGVNATSTQKVLEYFTKEYARIKHILIPTVDEQGNSLDSEGVKKAKATAEKVLSLAKTQKTDAFDDLIEQYNEDEGVAAYPDGYIFTQGEMVEEFETAAFDMEVGEIRMVKTEYGYHVMKKYSLEDPVVFTEDRKKNLLAIMYNSELETMLEEWRGEVEIAVNKAARQKFRAEKIELTTGA